MVSPTSVAVIGDSTQLPDGNWDRAAAIAGVAAQVPECAVTFCSVAYSTAAQDGLARTLTSAGVHRLAIDVRATVPGDRATATVIKGDRLRIDELFGNDVVILDFDDPPLRRFLTDLPAHTRPDVRLIAPLTWTEHDPQPDDLDVALRFDTLVATEQQLRVLTGCADNSDAVRILQRHMEGANLRAIVLFASDGQWRIVTRDETFAGTQPIALPALVATVAHGMARRLDWRQIAIERH